MKLIETTIQYFKTYMYWALSMYKYSLSLHPKSLDPLHKKGCYFG